jgi:TATA-box binding protein (TBP) (component of TFIID and TFIIIB)
MQYRVSTVTVTGSLGVPVEILDFFNSVQLDDTILFAQCKVGGVVHSKGQYTKNRNKNKKSGVFENQTTVIFRINKMAPKYLMNVKVFKTGAMQIAGALSKEDGALCIGAIASLCGNGASPLDVQVRLMNADFRVQMRMSCKALYSSIVKSGVPVSYDPNIYPAVKVMYMYNDTKKSETPLGICTCEVPCVGKGRHHGQCKKVTISIFQSGCVIVTGATSFQQLDAAHEYVTSGVLWEISRL